jgi:hypothetical protein
MKGRTTASRWRTLLTGRRDAAFPASSLADCVATMLSCPAGARRRRRWPCLGAESRWRLGPHQLFQQVINLCCQLTPERTIRGRQLSLSFQLGQSRPDVGDQFRIALRCIHICAAFSGRPQRMPVGLEPVFLFAQRRDTSGSERRRSGMRTRRQKLELRHLRVIHRYVYIDANVTQNEVSSDAGARATRRNAGNRGEDRRAARETDSHGARSMAT